MATAKQKDQAIEATDDVVNVVVEETASVTPGRFCHHPGPRPVRRDRMGAPRCDHPGQGRAGLRAAERRVPALLVADGDEHRRAEAFRGRPAPERERSVKQMIGRIVDTIGGWGRAGGYLADTDEAETFEAELKAILVNQYASFNSPVWFNVGFEEKPQCSACSSSRSRTRWSRSSTGSGARASSSAAVPVPA